MAAGVVVRVRVNPSTCIAVLDVLESVGIDPADKSFATCVSSALNILVETAQQSGVLPKVDPYQFANRMRRHTGKEAVNRRSLPKQNIGHINPLIFPETPLPKLERAHTSYGDDEPLSPDEEAKRNRVLRLNGLLMKKEYADSGIEGIEWTAEDQDELDKLSSKPA